MTTKVPQRRVAPRVSVTLDLLLLRSKGKNIAGRTVDVGAGGMCVTTERPLTIDEVLECDLPLADRHVHGRARVLRMQGHNVYALRFEDLDEQDRELLTAVAGRTA
jgi:c-di-GMP-binding flagellar brake protein YcgR